MRKYIELPLKLFLITFILGLLLGVTYMYTKEPIAEQRAYQLQLSREKAYPGADFVEVPKEEWQEFVSPDGAAVKEVFIAEREGEFAGYVINVLSKGYGGDVEIIVGVGADMHITNVVIGSHNETAGLGANATKPDFTDQFRGKKKPVLSKDDAASDQAVDALTGATITSRAVIKGIDAVIDMAQKLMEVQG
ncbi:MAG: FMN-binding protein [Eubacteriales bacterium]